MSGDKVKLTLEEAELCRQWFDAVQHLNPGYLERDDFVLAKRLFEVFGMRVPNSITSRL